MSRTALQQLGKELYENVLAKNLEDLLEVRSLLIASSNDLFLTKGIREVSALKLKFVEYAITNKDVSSLELEILHCKLLEANNWKENEASERLHDKYDTLPSSEVGECLECNRKRATITCQYH